MKEKLNEILEEGKQKIYSAKTIAELHNVKSALLGKQGALAQILKEIPTLEASERSFVGSEANKIKTELTIIIEKEKKRLI